MNKSYKDIGNIPVEYEGELLLDHVVELVGRFKKRSAIHLILQEDFPDIPKIVTSILISRAKAKIREDFNLDPEEFKRHIFEVLKQMISGPAKNKDRLKAIEMLATYSGANQSAGESPEDYARKVAEAMKAADASVDGTANAAGEGPKEGNDELNTQAERTTEESEEGSEAEY